MPSKKRKYNVRFPAGRIKKIMRIDEDIGKVALPVPVMISRALELFVSSLLNKAGDITIQKNARTLTLTHLKQSIYSDSRLDFLKELVKNIPDNSFDEYNDLEYIDDTSIIKKIINKGSDEEKPDDRRCVDDECLCRRGLFTNAHHGTCAGPPVTAAADTIAYLSAVRALLRTRRVADAARRPRCPAIELACLAVLEDGAWWPEYLLDALSSPADEYVVYAAVCAAAEAALCRAAGTSGDRFVDGLVRLSVAPPDSERHHGRAAAFSAFGRALDTLSANNDDYSVHSAAGDVRCKSDKTFLLDRLHGVWPTLVDAAVADGRTIVLFELVRLWKSVLVAIVSSSSSVAATDRNRYYATLPLLEHVLYRTDTDPHVWLNTVRLLGAGLRSRRTDDDNDPSAMALAERIATGVTQRRLLYFMGKMAKGRGSDRTKMVQETVLLAMRSLRVFGRTAADTVADVVDCLDSYVKSSGLFAADVRFSRWLVRLTRDRDDALIECLLCALHVAGAVPAVWPLLDPFDAFAEFLVCVSFDADVLLDFLISDENDFLPYAVRVLKCACADVHRFFRGCGRRLPDIMELLVGLQLKILRLHERCVFPYNVGPVAKLIDRCYRSYSEFLESRGRDADQTPCGP